MNDFIISARGNIYFAGRSIDSIMPHAGRILSGAVNSKSGSLMWMDVFATPGIAVTEANSVVETSQGLVRVAGFGSGGETYAQTMVFDFDADTGQRVATHLLGGEYTLRLHAAGGGSYRLVGDFDSLEGRRIRVVRLEETEDIFGSGFEVGGGDQL